MGYRVVITDVGHNFLSKIKDQRILRQIYKRLKMLCINPEKQGKVLYGELSGFRSIRVAKRYRAIFKIDTELVVVYIIAAGIRKEGNSRDIYSLLKKLIRLKLL